MNRLEAGRVTQLQAARAALAGDDVGRYGGDPVEKRSADLQRSLVRAGLHTEGPSHAATARRQIDDLDARYLGEQGHGGRADLLRFEVAR